MIRRNDKKYVKEGSIGNTNFEVKDIEKVLSVNFGDFEKDRSRLWDFSRILIGILNYFDNYWLIGSQEDKIRDTIENFDIKEFTIAKNAIKEFYQLQKQIEILNDKCDKPVSIVKSLLK